MAIQIRRGTDAEWESNNSNIVAGEPAVTLDSGRFFVGTGSGEFVELQKKVEGDFLTNDVKQALLQIASKVAYIDEHGQDYYDALESALYPDATLQYITAVYTQSGTVYDTDSLDSLKADLVVTAHFDDSSTEVITAYTLSGTLTTGTSTITVSYSGKTTTFDVTVTHSILPVGYTLYDYLYSNATDKMVGTYIATGVSFSNPTTAEYRCIFQGESGSAVNGHVMATRQKNTGQSNNTGFEMILDLTNNQIDSWSSIVATHPVSNIYDKYEAVATWSSNAVTIQVDEETPVSTSGTVREIGGYPICIFGAKPAMNASGGSSCFFFRGKVYYAEAKQDGNVIMQCYPCVRDSDGVAGMYDTVNDAFYTGYSIGTGKTITAGNDE